MARARIQSQSAFDKLNEKYGIKSNTQKSTTKTSSNTTKSSSKKNDNGKQEKTPAPASSGRTRILSQDAFERLNAKYGVSGKAPSYETPQPKKEKYNTSREYTNEQLIKDSIGYTEPKNNRFNTMPDGKSATLVVDENNKVKGVDITDTQGNLESHIPVEEMKEIPSRATPVRNYDNEKYIQQEIGYDSTSKDIFASKSGFGYESQKAYSDVKEKANSYTNIPSTMTKKEREARIKEIKSQLSEYSKALNGLSRASLYGNVDKQKDDIQKKYAELEKELKELERVGSKISAPVASNAARRSGDKWSR